MIKKVIFSIQEQEKLVSLIIYLLLIIFAVILLYPFLWMALGSFKSSREIFLSPFSFPEKFRLNNYFEAWKRCDFGVALKNSVLVSMGSVLPIVFLSSLAAYPIARMKFTGKLLILVFLIIGHMIPLEIVMIPLAIELRNLHLMSTLPGLILPLIAKGIPLTLIVLVGFFQEVPREIEDSAKIDGCSEFGIFWKIILPLCKPALSATLIFQTMFTWNEFLLPLVVIRRRTAMTIPLAIQTFTGQDFVEWEYRFAALTLAIIPVIVAYFLLQRQFIRGLTFGALKE